MSTYWGFACKSHDPVLVSELWFNHGDGALRKVLESFRSGHWPTDEWDDPLPMSHHGYATAGPLSWLREHAKCSVGIINEYGNYAD